MSVSERRTRLICTIGPASVERLPQLIEAGMDVARINFSHGTPREREASFRAVRRAAAEAGRAVPVLADLPGPKIRLGPLAGGSAQLRTGARFALHASAPGGLSEGDGSHASANYVRLADELQPGDRVLLADGAAELRVAVVRATDGVVECVVVRGGVVRSRSGVNVPSERLSTRAVTEQDRKALEEVLASDAELVAQSFVRRAQDVEELRALVAARGVRIVAKIETRSAVVDIAQILRVSDEVMIARGDLGVEIPYEEVPIVQKRLVALARDAGVPPIVATQMLESMTDAPRPTRAEASDVANAVLDGADALLLSAETAVGRYPVEAARAATAVARYAEEHGNAYRLYPPSTRARRSPRTTSAAVTPPPTGPGG